MITAHPVEGQVNSLRGFVHCLDLRLKRKQNELIIIKKKNSGAPVSNSLA